MQVSFRPYTSNDNCIICTDPMNNGPEIVGHEYSENRTNQPSPLTVAKKILEKEKINNDEKLEIKAHIFHKKCLYKWRLLSNTCPICRKTIAVSTALWKDNVFSWAWLGESIELSDVKNYVIGSTFATLGALIVPLSIEFGQQFKKDPNNEFYFTLFAGFALTTKIWACSGQTNLNLKKTALIMGIFSAFLSSDRSEYNFAILSSAFMIGVLVGCTFEHFELTS